MSNCSRFSVFSGADLMFDIRVVLGDTRLADHCSKGRFLRGRRASFVSSLQLWNRPLFSWHPPGVCYNILGLTSLLEQLVSRLDRFNLVG
jgi:hypothetical protein